MHAGDFQENNFSSDVAKREDFFPTIHKLTPQLKKKKKKKKKNSTSYSMRPTSILKKKKKRERRRRKKEARATTCCGAELTHCRLGSGRPSTLRPTTPPIRAGQTQPWVWRDPRSSSPADLESL
jgi:hypothetical protein